ncbi:TIGR00297 family protein, partial [Prochlorococcus sp. AH-736-N10]|nr:TIGR00297 family protein [Prochlorococcus sp. AH-736-N10]
SMAFVMLLLSIISTKNHYIVVAFSGFLATLFESIIGAKFQNKYKLSNELVNAIQTSIASVLAIFALIIYSYF